MPDDDAAEDVVAVDGDAVTAAPVEAIALIDMTASLAERLRDPAPIAPPVLLFNAAAASSRRGRRAESSVRLRISAIALQPTLVLRVAASSRLSKGDAGNQRPRVCTDSRFVSRPCELERGR